MDSLLYDFIKCDDCGQQLELDPSSTMNDYLEYLPLNTINLSDSVDSIIGRYLVYKCSSCNSIYKFTYKEIEKELRKRITEKLLMLMARSVLTKNISLHDKFFIYCGKCGGVDGSGSCTISVFNNCDIKRFPLQ